MRYGSVAVALLLAMLCAPANAAKLSLTCASLSSTDEATKYMMANQFIFDTDAQSLDMRIARSDLNWLFVTQKSEFIDDVFAVKFGGDGTVAAAGLRNTIPVAFRLTPGGQLDFAYITPKSTERIRYNCAKDSIGAKLG